MSYEPDPDPDFRLAQAGTAHQWHRRSKALDDRATAVRKVAANVAAARGEGAEEVIDALEVLVKDLNAESQRAAATAKLYESCAHARAALEANAPTIAAVKAAWERAQLAHAAVVVAIDAGGGQPWLTAREEWRRLTAEFDHLRRLRSDAIDAYNAAEDAAVDTWDAAVAGLGRQGEVIVGTRNAPAPSPGAPAPAPPLAPGAPEPPSLVGPPSFVEPQLPESPGAPAPPTGEVPAPGTNVAGGGGLDPRSMAIGMLAAGQAGQGMQQAQQPAMAPPMAAPPPSLSPPQQRPAERPFGTDDLATAMASGDPTAILAALGAPRSTTVAAPAITPASVPGLVPAPEPSYTGINVPGATGSFTAPAANAMFNPTGGTGTSVSGLETSTNVSGRPDNAVARTATSPASHLSAATASQAAAPGGTNGQPGIGSAAGAPMVPMMGGMGGGAGHPNGDKRDPVTAKLTDDQIELLGLQTTGEAVQGGTINRNDGDGDDKR